MNLNRTSSILDGGMDGWMYPLGTLNAQEKIILCTEKNTGEMESSGVGINPELLLCGLQPRQHMMWRIMSLS